MDWVKDKKNQPIVIAVAVVVILLVGVLFYFEFMKPASTDQTASTTPATPAATPGATPGAAAAPGAAAPAPTPGAPAAPATGTPAAAPAAGTPGQTTGAAAQTPAGSAKATAASQQFAVKPMETWRGDPFEPIGYKPPKKGPKPKPAIIDFPFDKLPGVSVSPTIKREPPEIQQPARRMAGILLNDRVYAIIESNGQSQVVQPGDYLLPDRLAMVDRIEPDKVVLKTIDKKPRYIAIRMAASAHTDVGVSSGGMSGGGGMGMPGPPVPMAPPSRGGRSSMPAPGAP